MAQFKENQIKERAKHYHATKEHFIPRRSIK
jgi:hypothetical protein